MSDQSQALNNLDLIMFDVQFLTRVVDLNVFKPRAAGNRSASPEQGIVVYSVFAKNAEDAIARLRAQEPIKHPVIEIATVNPAPPLPSGEPRSLDRVILPIELRSLDQRLVKGH